MRKKTSLTFKFHPLKVVVVGGYKYNASSHLCSYLLLRLASYIEVIWNRLPALCLKQNTVPDPVWSCRLSACHETVKSAWWRAFSCLCSSFEEASELVQRHQTIKDGKMGSCVIFYKWLLLPVGKHPEPRPFHPQFHCLWIKFQAFGFYRCG